MLQELEKKLMYPSIPPSIILSGAKIITDQRAPVFSDLHYFPFYYHLGNFLKSKRVYQEGHQMGLVAYAFLKGCKCDTEWLFSENPPGVASRNVSLAGGCPRIANGQERVDLALVTFQSESSDVLKEALNRAWNMLSCGWLVVDYLNYQPTQEVFSWFQKVKNKQGHPFPTFYGTGLIEKI